MKQQFNTAEDLMDHLKKQIIQYSEDDDMTDLTTTNNSSGISKGIDLSRFFTEKESNNSLWNISADRPITSHRKLTGKFIVFGKKITRKLLRWYVSKTFELQSSFNGSVTRSINELSNVIIQLNAKIEENDAVLNAQQRYIETLQNKVKDDYVYEQINSKINEITSSEELKSKTLMERFDHILLQTNEISDSLNKKMDLMNKQYRSEMDLMNKQYRSEIDLINERHRSEINFMQYRLRQIKKNSTQTHIQLSSSSTTKEIAAAVNEIDSNSFDYLHFENKFRGSVEEIKSRQRAYLPYFINKENVLDIGCGRGEFIELLIENNISVKGIDLNQEMVEYCQDRGLPVEYDDAIRYLSAIGNNELGGLFLGQVIEHMPFDQIILLVEMAFKKLKPGSYLIMETPNPMSLAIFYRTFYVDPTHVKPVHPLTIQYLVESVGFTKTELSYSSRVEPNWWVPNLEPMDNTISNLNEFNQGINRVNDLLFGNLDYAIIARK
jgi:2-polyprenyl-3-methyl-5-hydroxy-6-metoxy-1,4-benzoquinol methylase